MTEWKGSTMNDTGVRLDIKIAGAGAMATGVYNDVTISGSGTLTGDIECVKLKVSGAANGQGSLKADRISVSGSFRYYGAVTAGETKVAGSADFNGSVTGKSFRISGGGTVDGDLSADEIDVQGGLTVGGDCEAERFTCVGAFTVGGLLNAGVVDLRLHGPCKAREIGGEAVVAREGGTAFRRLVAMFAPSMEARLTVDTIEGDDVRLERTTAKVVRGHSVVIGPGCDIGLVEYTESYSASREAKVRESRKSAGEDAAESHENKED